MTRPPLSRRFATAPMMDWSDRHCRYFFRQLSKRTLVYTEMVTTGALLHGDVPRHLDFDAAEHPLALQLGGSEPADLAACAKLAERWGYDEVNLNCGCPSERVRKGAFGACLMAEPDLVADCVKAMQDAVAIPVTVKHRLGIDRIEDYGFARRFVETLARAGCRTFIVHARNAWLRGLSPKENRDVPPLRYAEVHRLKREFPELEIIANGGIHTLEEAEAQLAQVDGVMLGRAAYHDPWLLASVDARIFHEPCNVPSRRQVVDAMIVYARRQREAGVAVRSIARHMIGLMHGGPGARVWRRMLSDPRLLAENRPELLGDALAAADRARGTRPPRAAA
ncbi:MAG: tRNA dihydrouridine(20/20a) synthase DusA [Burkholderiales bacterium]|jgi:tRNA-dihydrouridine synthase A|nr:tRNA dihydrouridine(20/20a) synthase DusA [Burkholderiales bacterium]